MTSYDQKCADLVEHFYPGCSEDFKTRLASQIQILVEDAVLEEVDETGYPILGVFGKGLS